LCWLPEYEFRGSGNAGLWSGKVGRERGSDKDGRGSEKEGRGDANEGRGSENEGRGSESGWLCGGGGGGAATADVPIKGLRGCGCEKGFDGPWLAWRSVGKFLERVSEGETVVERG
jgi:hypothetical protein